MGQRLSFVPVAAVAAVATLLTGGVVDPVSAAEHARIALAASTLSHVVDAAARSQDPVPMPATVEPTSTPVASGEIVPGESSVVNADDVAATVEFSGHKVDEHLDVTVSELPEVSAASAASELSAQVVSAPFDVSAVTDSGDEVTKFPANPTIVTQDNGPDLVTAVDPGVKLDIDVDPAATAGLDPASLRIVTREAPGEPWVEIPSYFDQASGSVKGEIDHLSQFAVIGTPFVPAAGPRIVLDPDDDTGHATWPGDTISELPYNVALANQVAQKLRDNCLADVLVTRGTSPGVVSHSTRAAMAAAFNPDLTMTVAFDALTGHPWGNSHDGGSKVYSRNGSDAARDSLVSYLPSYTGRPAQAKASASIPYSAFDSLPGNVLHIEALYLDHNYDHPVIVNGFGDIVNGVFTGLGHYLESQGFDCTNPATGGWPSPPSAAELAKWRNLGQQNYQTYGGDPVSLSTGNLVEDEPIFSLPGLGNQSIDLKLFYNSLDGRASRVGAGWSFGLGSRAQRFSDGSVLVVRGDGASFLFASDGAGGYTSEPGLNLNLTEGASGTLILTSTTAESWVYDAADVDGIGELTSHTDRQGNTLTLAYGAPDADDKFVPLASLTDEAGQSIQVGHDAVGRISSFTHPDGRVWALAYDGDGNLASITDPDGGIRAFTYDSAHRMLTATDKAGVTYLVNEYDAAGRVVGQWDAEHNLRTFDYNLTAGLGGSTTYTDNEGNQSVFVFDGKSRITQITDALGHSEHYTFDAANNVTSYTDAAGHTWDYQYDVNNHLSTETDPSGSQTHFTYTPTGEVATVTDEGGPGGSPRSTVMTVDSRGLTTMVMRPDGLSQQNTFDAHGDLVSTTDPAGGTVTFGYDARGNLVSTTDQLGRTSTFGYDSANRLVSATDPAGGTTTLVWDSNNRVVSQTNPAGGVTSFTYNANNKPLTRTDPDGAVTTFVWDDLFRMVSVTDPNGGTTTYSYNTEDAMVSVTDAAGSVTSRTLDALNRPVAVTDANGNQWASAYDAVGNVVASTDPLGAVTTFGYDAVGRPIAVTDALGNSSTTTYDAVGRVVSASDALGGTISYVYDVLDRPVLVTDRGGFQRAVQYGPLGNVVKQVDERGKVTTFTYDAAGQLTAWAGPEGTGGSFAYDSRGNRVSATDAVGRTTTTAFDALKRPTSRTDPLGNTATVAYDAVGRVVSATDANGGVSSLDYDPAGNLLHSIDQLGNVTSYLYDALGRQRGVTDPSGSTTRYSYDGLGRLASVTEGYSAAPLPGRTDTNLTTSYDYTATGLLSKITNPAGAVTRFGYNQVGVKTSETNPLGSTWAFTVDALGRTTGMVDGNDKTTTYQYTARSQVSSVVYPGGVTVGYQYDAAGNLIAMTDALGSSGWIFDDAGRQTAQFDALGKQVRTGYDATGARTSVTLPGGAQIAFSFDAAGRPTGEASPWGSVTNVFDEVGNLLSATRSTGVVSSYGYDAANRVTSIVHQTPPGGPMGGVPARLVPEPDPATLSNIPAFCPASTTDAVASYLQDRATPGTGIKDCHQTENYLATRTAPVAAEGLVPGSAISLAYSYNGSGDVVSASRTDGGGPKSTTVYGYDRVHRLAASTSPEGSNSYGYDRAGNRTSWVSDAAPDTGDALSVTAGFNLAGQLVSESKTRGTGGTQVVYDYDGNGNRTRMRVDGATTDYRLDAANHLIGVSRAGMVTTSEVDGLGRQLVTATTTGLGTASTTQVWDGLHIIQQNTPEGTRTLLPDVFGDVTLQADSGGGQSWLLADRQGSIIAQASNHAGGQAGGQTGGQASRVTQLASYSDWGVQSFATTGWDAVVGFTGELTDPTTGINRYFARGYTPTSGVWVSPDPHRGILTAPATQHRYGYVGGNPVTLVDSLGFGWIGYGSANRAPSSANEHTADGWERILTGNPNRTAHAPGEKVDSLSARHIDFMYTDTWKIGSTRMYGSPGSAMDSFKQHPQEVFPFTVGGCDTIKAGEVCSLDVNDWIPDLYTSGAVKVSETPTSFTFTVHSDYYFVSRGSTITFTTYERGGDLYLEQHGEALETTPIGDIGYYSGLATAKWKHQSETLALMLRPDVDPNVDRYISPPSDFERLNHKLPVGGL